MLLGYCINWKITLNRCRCQSGDDWAKSSEALDFQLPAGLYHYLLVLEQYRWGLNSGFNHLGLLPLERLGDHLVIGKSCDDDGVWGIHVDDLSPKQDNPMVQNEPQLWCDWTKRNSLVWWELPLAEFLLAQARLSMASMGIKNTAPNKFMILMGNQFQQDLVKNYKSSPVKSPNCGRRMSAIFKRKILVVGCYWVWMSLFQCLLWLLCKMNTNSMTISIN